MGFWIKCGCMGVDGHWMLEGGIDGGVDDFGGEGMGMTL